MIFCSACQLRDTDKTAAVPVLCEAVLPY